jgi:excisionase family DNA binding protein
MKLLSPQQAADFLQVSLGTLYVWSHEKFIPVIKAGRLLRFDEDELVRWLKKRETNGRTRRKIELRLERGNQKSSLFTASTRWSGVK